MKKSVNKNKKTSLLNKRNIIIAVILLVIALPFAKYGYAKWLDAKDYERFQSVKATVEEVGRRLQQALPELEWKTEATCRRAHLAFGDGEASCEIRLSGETSGPTAERVKVVYEDFNRVLAESKDIVKKRRQGAETPQGFMTSLDNGYVGGGFTDVATSMQCGDLEEITNKNSVITFSLDFSCGDNSRDTWFPRSDK